MKTFTKLSVVAIFLIFPWTLISQDKSAGSLSGPEIETYKSQIIQLVKYLEGTLNFLGDPSAVSKEKETIINSSYDKIFKDDKVQIEDDLDENREVPIHKDVQAYLKDIEFFFKEVKFQFIIIDISHFTNEANTHFFKVTFNRDLIGVTINGDSVSSRRVRYMEINLNMGKNDLKIASIYTTKLNEQEEIRNWWNGLNKPWREFFGKDIFVYDSIELSRVAIISDSLIFVSPIFSQDSTVKEDIVELELPDDKTMPGDVLNLDSVFVNTKEVYTRLSGIRKLQTIDVSGNKDIRKLDPLSELTELTQVNCSNTLITSLFPLRNLNKLLILNFSNTPVNDVSPLMYSTSLKELNCSYTLLKNLNGLAGLVNLEKLDMAGLRIDKFEFITGLKKLKEANFSETLLIDLKPVGVLTEIKTLDISQTRIFDLTEIKTLVNLTSLNCDKNSVSSLAPLSGMKHLEVLKISNTEVENLKELDSISALKRIYWDNEGDLQTSPEKRKSEAIRFMKGHPGTLVIFESEALMKGWSQLEAPWKKITTEAAGLPENPGVEELHSLLKIEELDLENSGVTTIMPIRQLYNLKTLNLSGLMIDDYSPLSESFELEKLNISNTGITDLTLLSELNKLKELTLKNTDISSLMPLANHNKLEIISADSSGIHDDAAFDFLFKNPSCLVVFKTAELNLWWGQLPKAWKDYFSSNYRLNSTPTSQQLHKILSEQSLEIKNQTGIVSLEPLTIIKGLNSLAIISSQLTDLAPLTSLKRLKELQCNQVPINDISSLNQLSGLEVLNLENTRITDIKALANLTAIRILNISGTQVKSLKGIENLSKLEELTISNTEVKSIKGLESLPALTSLKCFNTKISEKNIEKFKSSKPNCEVVYY